MSTSCSGELKIKSKVSSAASFFFALYGLSPCVTWISSLISSRLSTSGSPNEKYISDSFKGVLYGTFYALKDP